MAAELFDLMTIPPGNTNGVPTGDSTWRIAVQMVIASGGAILGMCKVGTAKVSSYEWLDITTDVQGMQWQDGKEASGPGYPAADVGIGSITLDNKSGNYSPYTARSYSSGSISHAILNREFRSGSVIRIVTFKPTASCSGSTDSNGFTDITFTNWYPLFTGITEAWDETVVLGTSVVNVKLIGTLSQLADIDGAAVTSVGAGESLCTRLVRLGTAANWKFGYSDVGVSADYTDVFRAQGSYTAYTLQATTMSTNRLAEVKLSCTSILNTHPYANGIGQLQIGTVPAASTTPYSPVLLRFQDTTTVLTSDATNYPNAISTYYESPVTFTNNEDSIINDVAISAVGGVTQTASSSESQGLYGLHSYKRADLICTYDSIAGYYATALADTYDGFNVLWTPVIDQSIQPSLITLQDQQASQRIITLHMPCLVDYYGSSATPKIRVIGRITSMKHTIAVGVNGISWHTELSVYSSKNYIPT